MSSEDPLDVQPIVRNRRDSIIATPPQTLIDPPSLPQAESQSSSARRTQRRRLTQQRIATQEEERRRLSQVLHDETAQALIALKIHLGLIQDDLPPTFRALHRRLGEALALTTETIEQIRSLAHELRPPALDAADLSAALTRLCENFAKHTGLILTYAAPKRAPTLPDTTSLCLYRFVQEALTNVAKHASASRVHVSGRWDAEQVTLMVKDDGRGFDPDAQLTGGGGSMGIGLLSIRERFESLGGQLTIVSQPGEGTCLTASLPIRAGRGADR